MQRDLQVNYSVSFDYFQLRRSQDYAIAYYLSTHYRRLIYYCFQNLNVYFYFSIFRQKCFFVIQVCR